MSFLQKLQDQVLVADGAMGTLLHSYGIDQCFEALNLSEPEQIRHIHQLYIDAGADVIQTNTYGANRSKLARHGLENDVHAINEKAVHIARQAAEEQTYVVGTMGGIHGIQNDTFELADIKAGFQEQLDSLLQQDIDGLLLETYYDLDELTAVLRLARSQTTLPIIAQVSMHEPGLMQDGTHIAEALRQLEALGADVIGMNCHLGPYHMIDALEEVPLPEKAVLSIYPNAGLPEMVDGRYIYQSEPRYFADKAPLFRDEGAHLIGGCCGTTPSHIKAMAQTLSRTQPVTAKEVKTNDEHTFVIEDQQPSRDELIHVKAQKQRAVIVELDPPKKLAIQSFMDGVQALQNAGVDALTLADNSLATPRISNVSMATLAQQSFDVSPLVHIACRDRNLINLQSHLMGLHTLGIRQILAITGDPTKVGDFPGASSVFDTVSFGLIKLCKKLNQGISYSGKPLGQATSFSVGGAFNPNVLHLDKAVRRLEKKIKAGADYVMTQPMYSTQQIKDVYEETKHLDTPIFAGIMPLTSAQNAEFLHNEVPGMKLSDDIRQAMAPYDKGHPGARREGLAIAKELIDTAMTYFNGIYLVTPFMRYDMTVELTEYIHRQSEQKAWSISGEGHLRKES